MENQCFSRRSFVKASVAAGALAAIGVSASNGLTPSEKAFAADEEKIIRSSCRSCITWCPAQGHVRNGRLTKIEPAPGARRNNGRMCLKGLSQVQAVYNPNRLKYPMKRVGERGENKWERISWDEAIDTIAKALVDTIGKYGGEALFCSSGGGGFFSLPAMAEFNNALGGCNTFEPGAAHCHTPRRVATALGYGTKCSLSVADGNGDEIFFPEDCAMKALVIWGNNPASNSVAAAGRAIAKLRKENGLKTVVVDPRFTPDASKADVWLPIRPGTDVAMAMGWTKYIIDNKKYDEEFCLKWSNAPYLVNPETKLNFKANELFADGNKDDYVVWDLKTNSAKPMPYPWDDNLEPALLGNFTVTGPSGKTHETLTGLQAIKDACDEWTIERTAEVTWCQPEKIQQALDIYCDEQPSSITHGVATEQQPQAMKSSHALVMLELMMGHIERPGVIINHFGKGYKHDKISPRKDLPAELAAKTLGSATKYRSLFNSVARSHIPSLREAIETGKPYRPRIWVDFSMNKLSALAEPKRWVEAAKQLDHVFQTCLYMTSFTYECVDIALPVPEWSEMDGDTENQLGQVVMRQRMVHTFETVDVLIIMGKILQRCKELGGEVREDNLGKAPKSDEELRASVVGKLLKGTELEGMSFEEYGEYQNQHGYLLAKEPEKYRLYELYKHIDEETGKPMGFTTRSKKAEIYGDSVVFHGLTGAPYVPELGDILGPAETEFTAVPYYEEPSESPLSDDEFPLVLTTGRLPMFHHGTLRNVPYLREIMPVPELWINPATAAEYAIENGGWVKVSSRRGSATYRAKLTEGVNPGVVATERFWNPECMENPDAPTGGWEEMNVQNLTKADGPYCPEVGSYTLRGFQVKVEPGEKPAGIWCEPQDFEPWLPQPADTTEVVF